MDAHGCMASVDSPHQHSATNSTLLKNTDSGSTNTQTLCDTTDEPTSLTPIDITKLGVDIDLLSNPDEVVAKISMNLNESNYDELTYHLHELSPRDLIKTRPSMGSARVLPE